MIIILGILLAILGIAILVLSSYWYDDIMYEIHDDKEIEE